MFRERAGKIAILTNAGEKSQKVSELYKFHNDFEESYDVLKNLLQSDTSGRKIQVEIYEKVCDLQNGWAWNRTCSLKVFQVKDRE